MDEETTPALKQSVVIGWIGALLVRFVVPAWIIFGAVQKVIDKSPKSLPRPVLDAGGIFGFEDYHLLLAIIVSIEFYFVGIMLFVPKLARRSAVLMLGVFLIVLGVDMFGYGNYESCGCFGEKSLSPVLMFAIDFALLLGIFVCKPRVSKCRMNKGNRGPIAATLFLVLACMFTFNSIMNAKKNDNTVDPTLPTLPSSWYPTNIVDWIGKSVDDVELFGWVKEWPKDIHVGKQYVIFYSLTCDHCEALLWEYFEFPAVPTTLVAIPQSTEGFDYNSAFENPCYDCEKTELRTGTDWIIGTPLVVALDNGIIQCATEKEDYEAPACLIH